MVWSPASICYTRKQAAAERSMSRMVTQLLSDVASSPTRSWRSARLSVVRRQSAGAGPGLKTKRSLLGAHLSVPKVLVDYSSSSWSVSALGSDASLRQSTTKTSRHVSSPHGQKRSAWARILGSYAQCTVIGASLRGARPQ